MGTSRTRRSSRIQRQLSATLVGRSRTEETAMKIEIFYDYR